MKEFDSQSALSALNERSRTVLRTIVDNYVFRQYVWASSVHVLMIICIYIHTYRYIQLYARAY